MRIQIRKIHNVYVIFEDTSIDLCLSVTALIMTRILSVLLDNHLMIGVLHLNIRWRLATEDLGHDSS